MATQFLRFENWYVLSVSFFKQIKYWSSDLLTSNTYKSSYQSNITYKYSFDYDTWRRRPLTKYKSKDIKQTTSIYVIMEWGFVMSNEITNIKPLLFLSVFSIVRNYLSDTFFKLFSSLTVSPIACFSFRFSYYTIYYNNTCTAYDNAKNRPQYVLLSKYL